MNKNVKRMFFVTALILLLVSISAVSAADTSNDTSSTIQQDVVKEVNVEKISTNDNKIVDTNTKNIKKEAKTHIVNNDTVKNVFSNTGKSEYAFNNFDTNTLNDTINEGDILDFQGTITGNYNLTINKAVNIISSTNDALISLNTSCINLVGSDPGNSFSVISSGSNTNITGINFYNTQLFVINATNVTIDHINATVNGNHVGGGIGQTSIRENSTNITVKNSNFYTKDNGGSSTFVLAWAQNCTIINNTFNAEGESGNLFYLTTFNVDVPADIVANSNNTIINNTIGKIGQNFGGIQLACVLSGANNTLESNLIAGDISTQWGGAISDGYTILNNNTIYGGISNDLQSNWTISNNQFYDETNIYMNSNITNNVFTKVTLYSGINNLYNNTIENLDVQSEETTIINNTINGVTNIRSSNNQFTNNTVITTENYTINVEGNNNTITGNYLIAGTNGGNKTITTIGNNIISDNLPLTNTYNITDETYTTYFDDNGYLVSQDIQNYDIIRLIGQFNNKNFILDNRNNSITGIDCIINNGQIKAINNGQIGLENLIINNNEDITSSIIIESDSNLIKNVTINHNTNKDVNEILTSGKNNKILSNTINITTQNTKPTTINAITIQNSQNNINNNNIIINSDENTTTTAIYFPKEDTITNTNITSNKINISSTKYAYAINILSTLEKTNITSNNININSENINAINLNEVKYFNITRNTINLKANTATSININNYESAKNSINNIRNNNINIEANNITAMKILSDNMNVNQTGLYYNELNLVGNNTTAMILMGKCQGLNNKISIKSQTTVAFYISNANETNIQFDSTNPLTIENGTAAIIKNSDKTTISGIINTTNAIIYNNTTNLNLIYGNNKEIRSNDEYAIIFDSCENISLENWYIVADNYKKCGDNAINVINGNNITIKNNIPANSTYLSDETYRTLFDENNNYIGTTQLFIGPNITNKTLIFNTTVNITGVNNLNISDSSIKFTTNALNSNITQINTYNTQIILESNNTRLTYSNMTQDKDINPIISINNANRIYTNNNNIKGINTTTLQIKINNSQSTYIQSSNITSSHQSNTPLIIINNSTGGISSNYLETSDLKGIQVVEENNSTIEYYGNLPAYMIELTDENYNQYFDENSNYIGDNRADGLILASHIYNKNLTFNKKMTIDNPNNYTLYNTTISNSNNKLTLTNLIINNTNYNKSTIIATDLNLTNNTIFQNGTNINIIFLQNSQQVINIENNNITCYGNNNTIVLYPSVNNQMIIKNNNIHQYGDNSHTIILEHSMSTQQFEYNNITTEGNNNTILEFNDITIDQLRYNNIQITGNDNIAIKYNITAVQIFMMFLRIPLPAYINNNNITIINDNPTTAIIIENFNGEINDNKILINTTNNQTPIIYGKYSSDSNIHNNYIESLDLCGNDAITTDGTKNDNTPTTTGYKSEITNIELPEKIMINIQNKIKITTVDSFGREITGTIIMTDDKTTSTSKTNTIQYKPTTTGEKTLTITYTDPTGKYNTISKDITITVNEPTISVDPITTTIGQTVNITARITADNETMIDINKGKVTFKVNGKTLKDSNGKIIYAKVVNGTATIENYEVPQDWAKDGTTIQAVYSGSTQCEKLSSEKINITVTPEELTLTTTATQTAPGQTTTLTATLSDNTINTGKIVFKINGKTVKDANGKVIYAKVVNGTVSVDYTLPESYKAGNYTVTATFIASGYARLEASETLTVSA